MKVWYNFTLKKKYPSSAEGGACGGLGVNFLIRDRPYFIRRTI
jgi:hypothetical protein